MAPVAIRATLWARRDFLTLAAWACVVGSLMAALTAFGRFMLPRPLIEPTPGVDAGWPGTYYASGTGRAAPQNAGRGGGGPKSMPFAGA